MKFSFRPRLKRRRQLKVLLNRRSSLLFHNRNQCSNNVNRQNDGAGDEQRKVREQIIPKPVHEQQIAEAQLKVDRLMNLINETYEKTLMRNVRLEELDLRSTDLFHDAEKMKNMAHKMQKKFFWEGKFCLIVTIASVSAIIVGGLLALLFVPKSTGQ